MKKQNIIITIAFILAFLIGVSVMLYPIVSDYINSQNQSRAIASYNEKLAKLSEADYSGLIETAREYNQKLIGNINRFTLSEDDLKEYFTMLNFTGTGIIGTLEIEILKVKLPVYLGTNEGVLQVGIGHLEGSSIPIGGPGTHSVVSGHRGLPSSTLLTNAGRLEIGDVFVLQILNERMYYEIDHKVTVDPDNFDYLGIDPEMDYCTLLTCTPIGQNTHRLLLRGVRIFPDEETPLVRRVFLEEARPLHIAAQYALAAIPVLIVLAAVMLVKVIKSRHKQNKLNKINKINKQ
jgi:sortase A